MTDNKSYIIDPLTCLCKLSLLCFMHDKTRLAINNHVLYIQGYSCYQWIERTLNGDNRFDISNLIIPITKAIKWYLVENPEKVIMDETMVSSIKTITQYAIRGLTKLLDTTYNKDTAIKIIIQYYINLLKNALKNIWNEEDCFKLENNSILSDKIKTNFETSTVNSIATMLHDAENVKKSQEDVIAFVKCAHQLLVNRDQAFVKLMQEFNTTL